VNVLNRQYDNADFIYTFSDLMGMNYRDYDPTESILSKSFSADTILVGNPYQPKTLKKLEFTD
jgi:heptose-I-phosphate ethanolaminephosphotransferase